MKRIGCVSSITEMDVIARVPLFKQLTSQERSFIAGDEVAFFQADKGDFVIREGESDRCFYVLLSGALQVIKHEQHKQVAVIEPGEFVGEVAFVTSQARTADVIASDTCILLRVDQALMAKLPAKLKERINEQLISALVSRVEHLTEQVFDLSEQLECAMQQDEDQAASVHIDGQEQVKEVFGG
ncbi:hypothetical protein C2869_05510 [Saccharobesus litoralis]|uniref:Cyclic nucleotide-binding domain-containing protein n=1 Tax=Saccharobesus litoralis TaxID=2172099 RepID=A0A2S0VP19_9ALTE|nr:cyclic nucleotide-binding domain-containing protein [Saccharobesus litoralis]AWB65932.1 hypothetical protein C2869_05510 [Saccharobesus litoralis]